MQTLTLLLAALASALNAPVNPKASVDELTQLRAQAPAASPEVLRLALQARDCADTRGVASDVKRLSVIDYSRPSTEPRLWVFDLQPTPRLLYAEVVAHGRGSGADLAQSFSNTAGSYQSSLGLFLTAETYHGQNGYSLRLDGLEPGVNDHARARAIVMHGAPYVDIDLAHRQGRLGRSLGCPAIAEGQLLFAYYPDPAWLGSSVYLGCQRPPRGRVT
jgi:hypothetical protein